MMDSTLPTVPQVSVRSRTTITNGAFELAVSDSGDYTFRSLPAPGAIYHRDAIVRLHDLLGVALKIAT